MNNILNRLRRTQGKLELRYDIHDAENCEHAAAVIEQLLQALREARELLQWVIDSSGVRDLDETDLIHIDAVLAKLGRPTASNTGGNDG